MTRRRRELFNAANDASQIGKASEALAVRRTSDTELLHLLELVHAEDTQRVAAVRADLRASCDMSCSAASREHRSSLSASSGQQGVRTSLRKQVE